MSHPHPTRPSQAPQLALLHHNDLRHLADALLLLPACYGPELQPLLDEVDAAAVGPAAPGSGPGSHGGRLSFLEDALLLRHAAEEVMQQQASRREMWVVPTRTMTSWFRNGEDVIKTKRNPTPGAGLSRTRGG